MLIDWFTVVAQGVNFLVLVWLLKRFLYQPVLNAIDAREKHVAAQIQQAAAERETAAREHSMYESKSRELDATREQAFEAARAAAAVEREKLLGQARDEYARLRARLAADLAEEREDLARSISTQLEQEVLAVTERLVRDLCDGSLNAAIVSMFVRRLQSLGDADRESLRARLAGGPDARGAPLAVTLRTAFNLSQAQRQEIEEQVVAVARGAVPIRYELDPELIAGVELAANGYRLSWSVEDYLRSLREHVDFTLRSAQRSGAPTQ